MYRDQAAKLLCVSLLVYQPSVIATEYVTVAESRRDTVLLDTDSVEVRDGVLSAWFTFNHKEPSHNGALSRKALEGFDCENETNANISLISYSEEDGKGQVLTSGHKPEHLRKV